MGRSHRARAAYFLFRFAPSARSDEADRFARSGALLALHGAEVEAGVVLDVAEHSLARRRVTVTRRLLDLLATSYSLTPPERFTAAVLRVRAEAVTGAAADAARGALTDAFDLVPESIGEDNARAVAFFVQLATCAAQVGAPDLLARASRLALTYAPADRFKETREELARLERHTGLPDAT